MPPRGFFSRRAIRVTVVLAVLTALFTEDSNSLTAARLSSGAPLLPFASCPAACIENFDTVVPPALPSVWTSTIGGLPADLPWRTVSTASDSPPNSAFANAPSHVTDARLNSGALPITSSAVLTFSRSNSLEQSFDGMVLEISMDGGAFVDIISGAGGTFVSGGYDALISSSFSNPIGGRMGWTGSTSGFVTTRVNLPSSAIGRVVTFRWRVGTDSSFAGAGAFIDNITLTGWSEPPANDNFAREQPILGFSGRVTGSNVGATKEGAMEPDHAGSTGAASVWYRWPAPDTGRYVFTTYGSDFPTVIAVYTGNSFPLSHVASNVDDPSGCVFFGLTPSFSRVSFPAVGGTVYHIAVDRRSFSNSGNIILRWGKSATISGGVRTVDNLPANITGVTLTGDTCRRTETQFGIRFTDVPTGGNYDISIQVPSGTFAGFSRFGTTASISPLTGDVSNYSYYQSSPAYSISGRVTISGDTLNDAAVSCVAPLFTRTAPVDPATGIYVCSGLPIYGTYVVTPSKLGVRFSPVNLTFPYLSDNYSGVNFSGTSFKYTISGRVVTSSATGVSGVSIALGGSQTASRVTDLNGNYSFTDVAEGGNYTVTPSNAGYSFTPPNQSFNNLGANHAANFTATALLQLILDDSGQVAALDSMIHFRDPFPVINNANVLNRGVDRNTRVAIFLANFALAPGEPPSAVVINLMGSNSQSYNIPAEDVRPVSSLGFTQISFRLPDNLAAGICTLVVQAHGLNSNVGSMRIRS